MKSADASTLASGAGEKRSVLRPTRATTARTGEPPVGLARPRRTL